MKAEMWGIVNDGAIVGGTVHHTMEEAWLAMGATESFEFEQFEGQGYKCVNVTVEWEDGE